MQEHQRLQEESNYCEGEYSMSFPTISVPEIPREVMLAGQQNAQIREATIGALASNTAEYINRSILEFWKSIPDDYEVGMQLTSLGTGIQVYLNNLAYHEPHLIIFDSEFKDGTKMRIVQHVTQLNYALVAMPKQEPDKPKRIIGFRSET